MMRKMMRRCALTGLFAIAGFLGAGRSAWAAVASTGSVTPAPPGAGGTIGPISIGDAAHGAVLITVGSALQVNGAGTVGNSAAGDGTLTIADLSSLFSTSTNLTIGNLGRGSVTVGAQSTSTSSPVNRLSVGDSLQMGVGAQASGSLFVNNFGTIADVGDSLIVGVAGKALVQVASGGQVFAEDANVGQSAGSSGRVVVSGNDSALELEAAITIGDAGRGEVQIISLATALSTNVTIGNAATGTGLAVVSGAGSNWKMNGFLTVGAGGLGTINVLDGAQTTTTGAVRLATAVGSEAHGVVSGVNAVLAAGTTVTVGEMGFGTMDIRSSARLTSGNVIIADNAGSRGEVLVDGVGSLWKITGTLDVSDPGEAQLGITTGGQVTTTGVVRVGAAGRILMSTGRLDVAGAGGLTNNGLVQGTGRITGNVTNSATGKIRVPAANNLILANALTNAGVVDLDGGELEVLVAVTNNSDIDLRGATLRTGGAGLDNNSGAQVAITQGTVDVFGAVDNNAGAQIVVGGQSTAVFHDNLVNNGQFFVLPGSNVVALENLSFTPTSSLTMQLGLLDENAAAGQVDAAGAAALAGALAVTLAPGYAPGLGDAFQLVTAAAGLSGTFANASLPSLTAGLGWDVDYTPTSLLLSVVSGGGISADFDGDGDVDAADLAKWRTGFGKATGAVKGDGDANADGRVDGADFLAWQQELGTSASAAAAGAVPEPGSGVLTSVCVAIIAMACRKRRRFAL